MVADLMSEREAMMKLRERLLIIASQESSSFILRKKSQRMLKLQLKKMQQNYTKRYYGKESESDDDDTTTNDYSREHYYVTRRLKRRNRNGRYGQRSASISSNGLLDNCNTENLPPYKLSHNRLPKKTLMKWKDSNINFTTDCASNFSDDGSDSSCQYSKFIDSTTSGKKLLQSRVIVDAGSEIESELELIQDSSSVTATENGMNFSSYACGVNRHTDQEVSKCNEFEEMANEAANNQQGRAQMSIAKLNNLSRHSTITSNTTNNNIAKTTSITVDTESHQEDINQVKAKHGQLKRLRKIFKKSVPLRLLSLFRSTLFSVDNEASNKDNSRSDGFSSGTDSLDFHLFSCMGKSEQEIHNSNECLNTCLYHNQLSPVLTPI
ncbi:hypothetical protein TrispH2_010803 [Trichoplax sp. H2]|nr:hypothetical protein TrispH2_010803 [Trichoplax sp. H2]|eukprot:RDD36843.1 hypothetical protein TrispH2_010803 [Trichoplax sp. H2]